MVRVEYECWAELLSYPDEQRARLVPGWIAALCAADAELESDLRALERYLSERGESELEELFVRTFENNAERALELGWHLYGQNYSRGSFMARMRGLLREHGIVEGVELPDHASHVLRLMAHCREELTAAMASQVVHPALERIAQGFKDAGNPYAAVISALDRFITRAAPAASAGASS